MTELIELFPEVFLRIFTSDPAVIKEASWIVRLYSADFFIIPIQTVFQQITLSTGAVVLSAPVSDVLSVVVTVACVVPEFYRKMKNPDHFDGEKISLPAEN